MEVKVESKIGVLRNDNGRIYGLFSDCNSFQPFAAEARATNWRSETDTCSFTTEAGDVTITIVERRPNELVKYSIDFAQSEYVYLWVQIKTGDNGDSRVKITTKVSVNPMIGMFLSKPLKNGLDRIIDMLEQVRAC